MRKAYLGIYDIFLKGPIDIVSDKCVYLMGMRYTILNIVVSSHYIHTQKILL